MCAYKGIWSLNMPRESLTWGNLKVALFIEYGSKTHTDSHICTEGKSRLAAVLGYKETLMLNYCTLLGYKDTRNYWVHVLQMCCIKRMQGVMLFKLTVLVSTVEKSVKYRREYKHRLSLFFLATYWLLFRTYYRLARQMGFFSSACISFLPEVFCIKSEIYSIGCTKGTQIFWQPRSQLTILCCQSSDKK